MDAAWQEIEQRFGLDRWTVFPASEVCEGCRFLEGRVFFVFEGPRPMLHPGCRCGRLPVETAGLTGVALMRLVLEARSNGRQARFLEEAARRLSREDRVNRIVDELAERDATFVPVQ
jgi:hypothetical protein